MKSSGVGTLGPLSPLHRVCAACGVCKYLYSCRNLGKATELLARDGTVGSGTALGLSWPLCEALVFERLRNAEVLLQTLLL